jgi:hypothetical protein
MVGRKTSIRGKMSTCTKVNIPKAKTQKLTHNHSNMPLSVLTHRHIRMERLGVEFSDGVMEDGA